MDNNNNNNINSSSRTVAITRVMDSLSNLLDLGSGHRRPTATLSSRRNSLEEMPRISPR
jgi:hypothetical protein